MIARSSSQKKLFSEEGFNKLRDCGGFELLRCQSNCRLLEIISSKYTPESLRSIIGGQSKIYIRPIQANLSMSASPVAQIANTSEIKEKCRFCEKDILITDLRDHLKDCDDNVQTVQSTEPFAETQSTSSFSLPTEFDSVDNSDEDLPDLHLARNNNETTTEMTGQTEDLLKRTINSCIDFCTEHKVTDPVDILRHIQEKIVCGRDLDLSDDATTNDGETNFILVDRDTLLQSAFEEIPALTDLRLTLQVQFYEEGAVDLGGPRKEFFAILMRDIKQKYFDPVKEWSKDYEVIGKIFALSILQNGPLPRIMTTDLIEELFETEEPRQFVKDLRKGLDSLGFYQLVRSLPSLIHLFTPIQPTPITFKKITTLLKPEFAAEGSNRMKAEKKVYSKFLKYLREAA
ncbi:Hypothetical predicted protein, partial [Mytilus galloprovincialis]